MTEIKDYQLLVIKEMNDVHMFITYSGGYYTVYGTRRRLDENDEDDYERKDFYRSFHYAQFDVMVTYLKIIFNDFKENIEIAQHVIQVDNDVLSIYDYTVDQLNELCMGKNEIFAYDSYKMNDLTFKNLLGSIFYY